MDETPLQTPKRSRFSSYRGSEIAVVPEDRRHETIGIPYNMTRPIDSSRVPSAHRVLLSEGWRLGRVESKKSSPGSALLRTMNNNTAPAVFQVRSLDKDMEIPLRERHSSKGRTTLGPPRGGHPRSAPAAASQQHPQQQQQQEISICRNHTFPVSAGMADSTDVRSTPRSSGIATNSSFYQQNSPDISTRCLSALS